MPKASQIRRRTLDHGPEILPRRCDWPGCEDMGEYRAPKNRGLRSYYWFCLDHVRGYNTSWNYYEGMSADEIEQARRDDVTWNRPSWRLGGVGARSPHPIRDPFGIYEEEVESAHARPAAPARRSGRCMTTARPSTSASSCSR